MQDFDAVVERVVREVLGKLGKEGVTSPSTECSVCVSCGKCVEKVPDVVEKIKNAGAARISASPGIGSVGGTMAPLIDHTLLKPDASRADVEKLCREAREFVFAHQGQGVLGRGLPAGCEQERDKGL
jgi:deoxyribose-phosphate aldolase